MNDPSLHLLSGLIGFALGMLVMLAIATKHLAKLAKQRELARIDESLRKQNAKNEDDATRFAYLFSGKKTGSGALVGIEIRMLNGDVPTLRDVRAAVDECMKTPNAKVTGAQQREKTPE